MQIMPKAVVADSPKELVIINDLTKTVEITRLFVPSLDTYNYLINLGADADYPTEMKRIIEIGAGVLSKVKLVSDTDYFEKRIISMSEGFKSNLVGLQREFENIIKNNFDPTEGDSVTQKITRIFAEQNQAVIEATEQAKVELFNEKNKLSESINANFDPNNRAGHLGKLVEIIATVEKEFLAMLDSQNKGSLMSILEAELSKIFSEKGKLPELLDSRLSFNAENSPFAKFREEVKKEISDLREEIASVRAAEEATANIIDQTTLKGRVFEELVQQTLETIAKPHGDIVTDATTVWGITGAKKGDFLYDLNSSGQRLVVEGKDAKLSSLPETLKALNIALETRNADYAIHVVAHEDQLPKTLVGMWNEYNGNKIITHIGLLEVAIKYAKGKLMLEKSDAEGIDPNVIRTQIESINSSLKQLTQIKTQVSNIQKSGEAIETIASELRENIQDALVIIEEELAKKKNGV